MTLKFPSVMHSGKQILFAWATNTYKGKGSKYLGGHSDLLCGVLVVKTSEEWNEVRRLSRNPVAADYGTQLHHTRTYTGSTIGSLESWLLLRSLKTLHLRIPRQSETATALVEWLQTISKTPRGHIIDDIPGGVLTNVWHSSLQETDARGFHPKNQMTGGFNATFSIEVGWYLFGIIKAYSLSYAGCKP
jgi:cystathionine gamma-synthase